MTVSYTDSTSREDYDGWIHSLKAASELYYRIKTEEGSEATSDEVAMDDATYDEIFRAATAAEAANPSWKSATSITEVVGAGVRGGEVTHTVRMLSLDNVFSSDELRTWAKRLEKELGRSVTAYAVEPKIDGLALNARYVDGVLTQLSTRGDGTSGDDVTGAARLIKGLPSTLTEPLSIEIRGEVFMSEDDFQKGNAIRTLHGENVFANPRNGAAGTLRAFKRQYDIPLSFLAYGVVGYDTEEHSVMMDRVYALGVQTTMKSKAGSPVCKNIEEVIKAVESIGANRAEIGFDVDGAVIKADSGADRQEAGFSARAPKWGIAYKFPADMRFTKLLAIDLQVGRTGAVTPRAVLEPVFVGGTTISSATLHNAEEVLRKDLRIGDTVSVRRAGEVIPEVVGPKLDERAADSKPWTPPTACPRCNSALDTSSKVWRCSNKGCGLPESIMYFAERKSMDIDGLGDKLIQALVDSGKVADVADLYQLTTSDLEGMDRMGKTSALKVVKAIQASKDQPLWRVLTGLGIRLFGSTICKSVATEFGTLERVRAATLADLEKVDMIGPERAESIIEGLQEMSGVLDKLVAAGLTTTEEVAESLTVWEGMTVCVTGSVPGFTRQEAEEWIGLLGGKKTSSVSKKTSLVVIGDGAGSKATKAAELNVPTMTSEDYAALIIKSRV